MKLKVCGMKYQDNIKAVAALQPDYLGFIFYEKSARNFDIDSIPNISEAIIKTGVFVNETIDNIMDNISKFKFKAVQLHGNESPEFCRELKEVFKTNNPNKTLEIIKVFSIKNDFNFEGLKPYEVVCDYFLFDTKGPLPGGNGYTFDWNILKSYPSTKPFFLSGGIGLEEVEKLNEFIQSEASKYCYAIDVNSQFEDAPGLKNSDKLKAFKTHKFLSAQDVQKS
ncbi:phosphoribosylanthranilate isomerase [Gaetbulibacter aestuarii]|uniref:N-(5'-phosphoribosyl)anthranilate isomerase n=1 Tax=Gaetbulibacter aestuarii TaxID=1502358 RepID=A0ABW7MYC6_9FLAO